MITAEQLTRIPLFLGLAEPEADSIIQALNLTTRDVANGCVIVQESEPVSSLMCITKGLANSTTWSADRSFSIMEIISAPAILQCERLFGLSTNYSSTVVSNGSCSVLEITKQQVFDLLHNSDIFRLNFLNRLSSEAQRSKMQLTSNSIPSAKDLSVAFVFFVENISTTLTGYKQLNMGMEQLAKQLGVTRLRCSSMLRQLEERSLINVRRLRIEIPSMQMLRCRVQL